MVGQLIRAPLQTPSFLEYVYSLCKVAKSSPQRCILLVSLWQLSPSIPFFIFIYITVVDEDPEIVNVKFCIMVSAWNSVSQPSSWRRPGLHVFNAFLSPNPPDLTNHLITLPCSRVLKHRAKMWSTGWPRPGLRNGDVVYAYSAGGCFVLWLPWAMGAEDPQECLC